MSTKCSSEPFQLKIKHKKKETHNTTRRLNDKWTDPPLNMCSANM